MQRRPLLILATALVLGFAASPAWADEDTPGDLPETTTVAGEEPSPFDELLASLFGEVEVDADLGYGRRYELYLYASLLDVPVDDLISELPNDRGNGKYHFGWGQLKHLIEHLDGFASTFGQAVAEARRHQGRDAHRPDHAGRPDKPGKQDHGTSGEGSTESDA